MWRIDSFFVLTLDFGKGDRVSETHYWSERCIESTNLCERLYVDFSLYSSGVQFLRILIEIASAWILRRVSRIISLCWSLIESIISYLMYLTRSKVFLRLPIVSKYCIFSVHLNNHAFSWKIDWFKRPLWCESTWILNNKSSSEFNCDSNTFHPNPQWLVWGTVKNSSSRPFRLGPCFLRFSVVRTELFSERLVSTHKRTRIKTTDVDQLNCTSQYSLSDWIWKCIRIVMINN